MYDRNKAALRPGTGPAQAQGCTCMFQPLRRYTIVPGCPLHDHPEITQYGERPWEDEPNMNDDRPHTQMSE